MNSTVKQILIWVFMITCLVFLWQVVVKTTGGTQEKNISLTQLLNDADQGKIQDVVVNGAEVTGHYRDDKNQFHTTIPGNYPDMYKTLRDHGVNITIKDQSPNQWLSLLISIAPFALLLGLWFFLLRQMQSGGNKAMSFGKSRARLLSMQQKKITFKDVAGVDEAKEELKEIIEFLREAQKFQRLGGRIPKGVLLVGPPGTGKTLLARAVAGEANVPFFSISGSDFVEMFVGVGASRVRDLFEQGKKNAPCIIFIDEIDAVGRHRGAGLGGGHDEREQTLNQLLVEMDGFESNDGVILVAATNRPDVLDPALLRPGRFDRRVIVDRPDIRGREEVLKVHSKKVPMAEDVNLNILARGTPGFSGADLANMVNEAALTAARYNRKSVHMYDFEVAKDKVMMGAERKSMLLTDEEKRVTAYHEAGHTLVSALREHSDPLHKVTIIPRGMALGVTVYLPEEDQHTVTKDYLETRMATLMGGRCAEEIFLKQMTTGAGNDIERATELARKMVCEFGMSKMGPMTFGKKEEQIFLGREIAQHRDFSDDTAKQIDAEVRFFVDAGYKSAYTILESNQDIMHRMAAALLERETLDAAEIKLIIEGKELPAAKSALSGVDPGNGGETQKILKPEGGRKPGFGEGQPSPA
ncbi:ATP-dependent zinc metalloprotease FtsH [Tunturiibacter gelidoferens]|uniref:ATP-dependent zinc metalloprotease FtsH n=2 Tax=Tunturiibacter TaxID=3154218 RepID=A0A7Y9NLU4_9BACT|nr:ATP-dependent zinc metalloprotease FtsH [Edaphobacter lichenicola]MBB5339536.1 cell division protease FtsH [Edaphobacter lichenicola]NYF51185.1 cell division protease FtsH [Edaphobacter lichenicola]